MLHVLLYPHTLSLLTAAFQMLHAYTFSLLSACTLVLLIVLALGLQQQAIVLVLYQFTFGALATLQQSYSLIAPTACVF